MCSHIKYTFRSKFSLSTYKPPVDSPLDIIYQDEFLLIVDKPSGLLSVPGRGEDKYDSLIVRLKREYPNALIVHRLDMSTSGLMIIALSKKSERALSILFQKRKVHKKYIAIVEGKVKPTSGAINLPLITDWPNRPKQKVDYKTGKQALTHYRVLEHNESSTRLQLTPFTGRTHQLRVHVKELGHTILGDELYSNNENVKNESCRLLLHASELHFQHPFTEKSMSFSLQPEF